MMIDLLQLRSDFVSQAVRFCTRLFYYLGLETV